MPQETFIFLYSGKKLLLGLRPEEVTIKDIARVKRDEARQRGLKVDDIECRFETTHDFLAMRAGSQS